MNDEELVDALDEVWSSIDGVCAPLSQAQWNALTECPGWTVQDTIAHIIGIEAMSLGMPTPELDPPDAPHIKNDVGHMNEIWVESLRALDGAAVLDRFRDVTGQRLAGLRTLDADGFAGESWTPVGPGTVRDLLPFRIFDSWVHEQDIRRALGTPGRLAGPAADASIERVIGAMPYVIGKQVKPPDGTTVVFDLGGAGGPRTVAVGVKGGRGKMLETAPGAPTVKIATTLELFTRLGCGRVDGTAALADGAVTLSGDDTLGRTVVEHMNFMF
jgi:uncharacterized protein (TIGR03083 family)